MFNLNRMATIPQQLLARADSQGAVHYSTLYLRPLPFYDDRLLSIKEGGGGVVSSADARKDATAKLRLHLRGMHLSGTR